MADSSSDVLILGVSLLRNPFVREAFGTVDLFHKQGRFAGNTMRFARERATVIAIVMRSTLA